MLKLDSVYRVLSKYVFVTHVLLALCLLFFTFLPFKEGENYYQFCGGFYNNALYHPIIILFLPFLACLLSLLSTKYPGVFIGTLLCVFAFGLYVGYPKAMEYLGMGLSGYTKADLPAYDVGEKLLSTTTYYLVWFDLAIAVYSVFIQIFRGIKFFMSRRLIAV